MRNRRGGQSCIDFWFISSLSPRIKPTVDKKPPPRLCLNPYQSVPLYYVRLLPIVY
jgi:hypothetical protein|eukprot:COSAG01_NODE_10378_length_2181_cov_32.195005_2_plen_56_part_00